MEKLLLKNEEISGGKAHTHMETYLINLTPLSGYYLWIYDSH